jgi:transposase InsO family protein
VIAYLTGQGFSERQACRVVGVNRSRRRHSALNMLTPTEFEELHREKSS